MRARACQPGPAVSAYGAARSNLGARISAKPTACYPIEVSHNCGLVLHTCWAAAGVPEAPPRQCTHQGGCLQSQWLSDYGQPAAHLGDAGQLLRARICAHAAARQHLARRPHERRRVLGREAAPAHDLPHSPPTVDQCRDERYPAVAQAPCCGTAVAGPP